MSGAGLELNKYVSFYLGKQGKVQRAYEETGLCEGPTWGKGDLRRLKRDLQNMKVLKPQNNLSSAI